MSSKPPVMEYHESFSSAHVWKVERDVYNELVELIAKYDLPLSLDLLTAGNGSCCMIAILQGLQREDVSRHMSQEVIMKAKDYDTNWLRNAVSDYVLASPQKVKHLKDNYEIYQALNGSQVVWEELWSDSPRGMRNPNLWGNNYFLGAAALFLQINIKILDTQMQRTANTQTMFNTFYGNQEPAAPSIILGLRNDCHFQALIPVGTNYGVESEAQPNGIIDIDDENQSDQTVRADPKKRILTEEKKVDSPVPKKRVLTEDQKQHKNELEKKRYAAKLKENPAMFRSKKNASDRARYAAKLKENPAMFRSKKNASERARISRKMKEDPILYRTTKRNHQKKSRNKAGTVSSKDGLKSYDITRGKFAIKKLSDTEDAIGLMENKCDHCGAWRYKGETKGSCCLSGKVLLEPFPRPPEVMMNLWNSNTGLGRVLKNYSKEINNALALSSIQVKLKRFNGFTPAVIFQGKVVHATGSLIPKEGESPKFSQLYLCDPILEKSQRFANIVLPERTSSKDKNDLKKLIPILQEEIRKVNPYVMDLMMIMEIPDKDLANGKIIMSAKAKPKEEHARRYNLPTSLQEVSILTDSQPNDLVLRKRGGGLTLISDLNPKAMPLHFTLLFPHGTYGWDPYKLQANGKRKISSCQFYKFHILPRDNDNENYLLRSGRLFQEFVVIGWSIVERQRLFWHEQNQKSLRADKYINVKEAIEERADQLHSDDHQRPKIGRKILASSFVGGPRWYNSKFQDGMAICAEYRKPDLFLTFTCNTSWPEIQRELKPGEKAQNQPVLVARVFYLYVKQLMKDILVGQIFGKIDAYLWVIEFQKRGLPHLHLLIILANHDRLITADFVDSLISAEIPPDPAECEDQNEKKARQDLQDIVLSNMVHGPCGKDYPFKPCMENNKCTKQFPKPFTKETFVDPNLSYATYKRRSPEDGGRSIDIQGTKLDNRWIVPYCPFLSLKYDCHINLECCASTKSVKYLTKYIHKGNDHAMIRTEVEGAERDEISEYEDLRSVGSVEAAWHLLNYPIHKQFPAVMPLRVHLKDQQEIYFDENQEGEALERQQQTELTAWFEFNKKALAEGAKPGTLPRYVDMPKEHVFDKKLKIWKKRQR